MNLERCAATSFDLIVESQRLVRLIIEINSACVGRKRMQEFHEDAMPISALRIQAYELLALAIKADEEGRSDTT